MKIYDISVPLHEGMPIYRGDPGFQKKEVLSLKKGDPATLSVITMGSHSGTHFDAPAHMMRNGMTFDSVDPRCFFGKAIVVMIRNRHQIDRPELERIDFRGVRKVLFRTANSRLLAGGGKFSEKFVHFTSEAARYLAVEKKIELVGIDYLSVDRFHSQGHPAHSVFLKHGVMILETIDLSKVKPGIYDFFAGPLLIKGADSGPARVFLSGK